MSKTSLIIQREYLTRVKKKSFIIMTFLTPLLFAALVLVPVILSQTMKDESLKVIAVSDQTGLYSNVLHDQDYVKFEYTQNNIKTLESEFNNKGYYAILSITADLEKHPDSIFIYSNKQVSLDIQGMIGKDLKNYIREEKKKEYNIANIDNILADLNKGVNITSIKWGKDGKARESSTELAMVIGYISAFIIYMFIFMYGVQVMRGVIEEKTNRIVEVIVSSVKPFQLMMGKVIGLALVALTQFLLWVILSGVLISVIRLLILPDMPHDGNTQMQLLNAAQEMPQGAGADVVRFMSKIYSFNLYQILSFFIVYFIGGYLLYAALFAAIGSAVDNDTDTQQFMLPVTIPMVFALYVAISAINNPHGPLAFWCSLIPFTSPIVMMVRIPFEVPLWQLLVSVSLLILTFIGMIWVAARIYRTGILMYGKKVSYKEIFKWLRYKG
ncbi:ABC transporter permease [Saccharicrinis sp. FJH54]|uniref:ABC transporter permease n=1 Tax=Saccharicrinis sp. FJH54 TaxID=3344665 RepID=UPI0035D47A51